MDTITIKDLAVLCHIGVPDEERAKPQRLLLTVRVSGDFSKACENDNIHQTVNYFDISKRLTELCRTESFKLIEALANRIARIVLTDFGGQSVSVEVKKFILPDARYVSFELTRQK